MAFIQGLAWLQLAVEYSLNHPWITLGLTIGLVFTWKFITRPRNLPPGPFNWPILGAVSLLRKDMEVKLLEMRPVYGDVIYMKLFGNETVVLNSEKVIREAFLKRSDEFSHRQYSHLFRDMSSNSPAVEQFSTFNAEWKVNRKLAVTALKHSGFGTARSESKIHSNLEKLIAKILNQEGQAFISTEYVKDFTAASIFAIYFDENLPFEDPQLFKFVRIADEWFKGFNAVFVLYELILRNVPSIRSIVCWKAMGTLRKAQTQLKNEIVKMIHDHRDSFDPENIRDIIDYYLLHSKDTGDDFISFNIMIALPDAIDTSGVILTWLLFYLAKHQHVQNKLQDQIDDIIGMDRKPALSDRPKLPYADAIILEMLRCVDIGTVTAPRELKQDVELAGYRIPKGVGIIACLHSVHYDPDIFPEPQKFDPSRYIDSEGKLIPSMMSHVLAFSIGPRMCLGEQNTKVQLFLSLTTLTQKFSITFDPSQPEPPDTPDTSSGFVKFPPPHKLCFKQR